MTSAVTSSFSRKLSADEEEAKEMKRGRAEESADGLALMTSLVTSSQSADDLREQSQESAVIGKSSRELQYPVAGNPGAKNRRSSKAQQLKNESAAKQLTTYEEFMKVGCQLLSSIQMAKTTRSLQKKRTQVLFPVVSHTVAAVVHLRSLGVLTAAGCGIGSVHEVVRSNLLVEPSEVEEGEM
ncbi:hypothetical protein F511_17513 [Dorcoceras hygrometricum]|uniref:Uncharacterized protein n=1 Tax=Dorcoceras hygrometricum TaxID=472368 RepID=A0A2Z7CMV2_9LAMI|nr:hypothetical protein F511_17513 [Dorcoceras hygrometricum]